jgi:hypothetical protein
MAIPIHQPDDDRPHDDELIERLGRLGLKYPRTTVQEARRVGLPLSYALAFLEKESSGHDSAGPAFGLNLFGSDPVANPVKGGVVTHARYAEYLRNRRAGRGMQGVGPLQLTWFALQDMADHMGGCDKPRFNMRVGFAQAKGLIRQHGKRDGARRWNGSGPAAERYAADWLVKQQHWHHRLA